jgi:hypothetical protein
MADDVLQAIHDDDLMAYLESLGLLKEFQLGRLTCRACGDVITMDNLNAFLPDSGQIRIFCSKPDCVKGLMQILSERE